MSSSVSSKTGIKYREEHLPFSYDFQVPDRNWNADGKLNPPGLGSGLVAPKYAHFI